MINKEINQKDLSVNNEKEKLTDTESRKISTTNLNRLANVIKPWMIDEIIGKMLAYGNYARVCKSMDSCHRVVIHPEHIIAYARNHPSFARDLDRAIYERMKVKALDGEEFNPDILRFIKVDRQKEQPNQSSDTQDSTSPTEIMKLLQDAKALGITLPKAFKRGPYNKAQKWNVEKRGRGRPNLEKHNPQPITLT